LRRAFAIGFFVPQYVIVIESLQYSGRGNFEELIFLQISAVFCGIVSAATAWWLLRSSAIPALDQSQLHQ
jgi:hypothetical protein